MDSPHNTTPRSIVMKTFPKLAISVTSFLLSFTTDLHAATHQLNQDEFKLFKLISTDPQQMRPLMELDPILCRMARKRAQDMASKNYFSHVSPDGTGPNQVVTKAGYFLPSHYPKAKDANNIESIANAYTPATTLSAWKKSPQHHDHVLGVLPFYREQSRIGVGIVRKPGSPLYYFVFLSAPTNLNPMPPLWVLADPRGKVLTATRSGSPKLPLEFSPLPYPF